MLGGPRGTVCGGVCVCSRACQHQRDMSSGWVLAAPTRGHLGRRRAWGGLGRVPHPERYRSWAGVGAASPALGSPCQRVIRHGPPSTNAPTPSGSQALFGGLAKRGGRCPKKQFGGTQGLSLHRHSLACALGGGRRPPGCLRAGRGQVGPALRHSLGVAGPPSLSWSKAAPSRWRCSSPHRPGAQRFLQDTVGFAGGLS